MIPQLIVIAIFSISLGEDIANHGKEKKRTENARRSLVAYALFFGILYWGGFWDVFLKL